jgi:RimJ/RimL family protein N-acetyltransferase
MEQLAIETDRLILRPMAMSDVDDLLEYQSDPELFNTFHGQSAPAEKLNMRREAEFKDAEFFKGAWCDMWLYAILKREFPSTPMRSIQ